MGNGIAALTWLPENVDEDTCRDLARATAKEFDEESFFLLANRKGEVPKELLAHWTAPVDEEEMPFFRDQLRCDSRLEFLKKFKPLISHKHLGHGVRFKAELHALKLSHKMIEKHRVVPAFAQRWLESRGFDPHDLRRPALQGGVRMMTAMGEAAFCGDLEIAKWVYTHGGGPDARKPGTCYNGMTPMLCAAMNGHVDVCEWLFVLCGAAEDIFWPNHSGLTPLALASMQGHTAVCEWLFQRAHEEPPHKKVGWAAASAPEPHERVDAAATVLATKASLRAAAASAAAASAAAALGAAVAREAFLRDEAEAAAAEAAQAKAHAEGLKLRTGVVDKATKRAVAESAERARRARTVAGRAAAVSVALAVEPQREALAARRSAGHALTAASRAAASTACELQQHLLHAQDHSEAQLTPLCHAVLGNQVSAAQWLILHGALHQGAAALAAGRRSFEQRGAQPTEAAMILAAASYPPSSSSPSTTAVDAVGGDVQGESSRTPAEEEGGGPLEISNRGTGDGADLETTTTTEDVLQRGGEPSGSNGAADVGAADAAAAADSGHVTGVSGDQKEREGAPLLLAGPADADAAAADEKVGGARSSSAMGQNHSPASVANSADGADNRADNAADKYRTDNSSQQEPVLDGSYSVKSSGGVGASAGPPITPSSRQGGHKGEDCGGGGDDGSSNKREVVVARGDDGGGGGNNNDKEEEEEEEDETRAAQAAAAIRAKADVAALAPAARARASALAALAARSEAAASARLRATAYDPCGTRGDALWGHVDAARARQGLCPPAKTRSGAQVDNAAQCRKALLAWAQSQVAAHDVFVVEVLWPACLMARPQWKKPPLPEYFRLRPWVKYKPCALRLLAGWVEPPSPPSPRKKKTKTKARILSKAAAGSGGVAAPSPTSSINDNEEEDGSLSVSSAESRASGATDSTSSLGGRKLLANEDGSPPPPPPPHSPSSPSSVGTAGDDLSVDGGASSPAASTAAESPSPSSSPARRTRASAPSLPPGARLNPGVAVTVFGAIAEFAGVVRGRRLRDMRELLVCLERIDAEMREVEEEQQQSRSSRKQLGGGRPLRSQQQGWGTDDDGDEEEERSENEDDEADY